MKFHCNLREVTEQRIEDKKVCLDLAVVTMCCCALLVLLLLLSHFSRV